ncbi:transcription-repair coupling factor [Desulfobacca acetoxidans DSM 11109]|uniref:Transcription-repair-coupling factor n=2 Tax=Desulfobacca acetoxidans TaxID=60893 RepID=F2NC42_DESAR|nr:transcription-repair coupling factor [Desulfobacca acetoxidans DSM 11109]
MPDNTVRLYQLLMAVEPRQTPLELYGLSPAAASLTLVRLWRELHRPILLVTPSTGQQVSFYGDLKFFLSGCQEVVSSDASTSPLYIFPEHENLPFVELTPDCKTASHRLAAAYALSARINMPIITATPAALLQPLPPRDKLSTIIEYLVVGEEIDRDRFLAHLQAGGYTRRPLVEERGDYSVRGGVIDFFPPLSSYPVRAEFWGDTIDSLRHFNPATQRSLRHFEDAIVLPVSEVFLDSETQKAASRRLRSVKDPLILEYLQRREHFPQIERYLPYFYDKIEYLGDYLPENCLVGLWDPLNISQELKRYLAIESQERPGLELSQDDWQKFEEKFQTLHFHTVPFSDHSIPTPKVFHFSVAGNQELAASLAASATEPGRLIGPLANRLQQWRESGFQVILVCRSRSQAERLSLLLADRQVPTDLTPSFQWDCVGALQLTWNGLSAGFQWLSEALIVLTEEEVLGASREPSKRKTTRPLQFLTSLTDLKVGDPIVHLDHGVGLYRGLVKLAVGSEINDFLQLEYLGGDRLYLPVDRLHLVQKYMGVDDKIPPLEKLGGKSWEKTKKRVRQAVEKIARELVELYAARRVLPGHHFSPPDPALREFEATFDFEETPDQLEAIQDVLEDMASDRVMDRLICGDVGYGKTEVALRAAFKAAMDGKQVAFLVPTTVLAEQHLETFKRRFRSYPLEIRALSRFRAFKEQKRILADLSAGKVDIIIGTHRLLQKDVHFKELGLIIVDEEQRFGVSHKEKLKKFRQTVDVLTLSATPIPRTLQMAMTGIREMSIINTAPAERQSIKTYLVRPNDSIICEAVRRELERGGQVFFVHNRVHNLPSYVAYLKRLVPKARIGMAHGQMPEKDLEHVMWQFWRREIDVLVCTAIIESGLDIPAANTIIINRAHALGLAQIYQLRGRVGRGREQAYAYLLVPEEEHLNPEAQKRLKALMEFTELGSGFKIALHDLQIRGAGNILGAAQSGHIAEVGYELYLQLLEEEINRLKGEPRDETPDPELHLPLAAYLPESYIPDIDQRLMFYRRLSGRLTDGEIDGIAEELLDCYGPLMPEAVNLLEVVRAKGRLREIGIKRLEMNNGLITITFADMPQIDLDRLIAQVLKQPRLYRLTPNNQLRVHQQDDGAPLDRLKNCLKEIEFFVIGEEKKRIVDSRAVHKELSP